MKDIALERLAKLRRAARQAGPMLKAPDHTAIKKVVLRRADRLTRSRAGPCRNEPCHERVFKDVEILADGADRRLRVAGNL